MANVVFYLMIFVTGMFIGIVCYNIPWDKTLFLYSLSVIIILIYTLAGINYLIHGDSYKLHEYVDTKYKMLYVICIWPICITSHYFKDLYTHVCTKYNLK